VPDIRKPVADETDPEVDRLRRMFADLHTKREHPSRLEKIMNRLRHRKIKDNPKPAKKNKPAA
jgi:hypothetical protein